jgi:capsular exopolysaccharide synthesis family protein
VNEHKVVLLTSSSSGEGKSFIGLNLAFSFAVLDKKVIVLELDLRKPKISEYMGISRNVGITNYLINEASYDKIIKKSNIHKNLDVISCGSIPPNPAELLSMQKFEDLIMKLKSEYDYVILDTPPIGLVTDAIIIGRTCDISLYLVRQNYTFKGNFKLLKILG